MAGRGRRLAGDQPPARRPDGHVLHLDMGFHTQHAPGHLIERVDGDVTALSNFFSAMAVKVLGNGLLILGIIVLVARESWLLGLLVAGLVGAALLGFARLHAVAVPWWTAVSATHAEVYGQVGEQVEGTEDIVPNGAAGFMQERFAQRLRTYLPQYVRGWTGFGLMWATSQVLSSAMIAGRLRHRRGPVRPRHADGRVDLPRPVLRRDDRASAAPAARPVPGPAEGRRCDRAHRGAAGGPARRLAPAAARTCRRAAEVAFADVDFTYAGEDDDDPASCTTSTSRSGPAARSASSGGPARASPRWPSWPSGCTSPTRGGPGRRRADR